MSIYDREYIRVGPRSTSGLGSLRFISFNSWIILINVLVFVADLALNGYTTPVVVNETLEREVNPGDKAYDPTIRDAIGNPEPARVPMLLRDRSGRVFMDPSRSVPNPHLRNGGIVYRRLVDKTTGEQIGQQTV